MDVDHTVAVGVDPHRRLELGDVWQPLTARVDPEGHVDVVLQLRCTAGVVLLTVVAGVDDEPESEQDHQRDDAWEQEAARLAGPNPAAARGAAR